MIDLHCHILWGIDDGPKELEESMEVCRMLSNKGITEVVATPHYITDSTYKTSSKEIVKMVDLLNDKLSKEAVKLKVHSGMEVFLSPEIMDLIRSKEVLTLNNSNYILVETYLNNVPVYFEDLFYQMQIEGLSPILAHPERNSRINQDISMVEKYFNSGIVIQMNIDSLIGKYGSRVKSFAQKILVSGLVHVICTDTHCVNNRYKNVTEIEEILTRMVGSENMEKLLYTNPEKVLNNEVVEELEPVEIKRTFFKKLFSKR